MRRIGAPARDGPPNEGLLAFADRVRPDCLLQGEDEPGPDRLDDGGRPALLAMLDLGKVDVLRGVDVGDRAAARHRGDTIPEERPPGDQEPGRPGSADELVGRDEDRVASRSSRRMSIRTYGAAAA